MAISLSESEELFIPEYTKKKQSNAIQCLKQPFDKIQLTKLLINTLHELGYEKSAIQLQKESGGIQVESTIVQSLFELIKCGRFERCTVRLLFQLPLVNGDLFHLLSSKQIKKKEDSGTIKTERSAVENDAKLVGALLEQYENLHQYVQRLTAYDAEDVLKLTMIMEIFVLVLRQVFIELVFVKKDKKLALAFLRSVLRPAIQVWDSLLTIQTVPAAEETADDWPMNPDTTLLQMTTVLTCPPDSPEAMEIWGGSLEVSRQMMLDQISQYINPNDLVPRGRLITLLKQAVQFQKSSGLLSFTEEKNSFGNSSANDNYTYNLLQDNVGSFNMFNFSHVKTLSENKDEIWYLQFSPDGKYLASASADSSSDRKVLIYDVQNNFQVYKVLAGTEQSVLYLSFSCDSRNVVTCSFNENVKVYDIHTDGQTLQSDEGSAPNSIAPQVIEPVHSISITLNETPSSSISSASSNTKLRIWCSTWFHTKPELIALGSTDREVVIYNLETYSVLCRLSQTYQNSLNATNHAASASPPPTATDSSKDQFLRVHAVSISHDDKYLLCMSNETYIDVYDISEVSVNSTNSQDIKTPRISRLNIGKRMTSMSGPVGPDYSLLLISVQSQELQLWDFKRQIMVQRYVGQRQVAYIIRSCFGYGDSLVASGSEDGKIYIWDRYFGNIIGVLSGHTLGRPDISRNRNIPMNKICNVVTWNPVNTRLFASGGDDGLVKIWKLEPN
ncbi:glucose-induced degradation complex subunit GID7 Ecym_1039 [Eremothecium cymbalariae DBVPG|uniref:Uncharacterized protein n=1 Tax=Eremothecium cymbalariae (strain CBS 270.75 / DBVPG 7215 / KCTC 17166 / NRRL Y-17582) TaxID=931890 RepID=G8JM37_ERECY|nr:hypothetical protein Ecym_1039 [Eremothecium cymbalariae DBVPG\